MSTGLHLLIGAVLGGALGFGWQRLAGCSTGACPLMRSPWIATLYGLVVGVAMALGIH